MMPKAHASISLPSTSLCFAFAANNYGAAYVLVHINLSVIVIMPLEGISHDTLKSIIFI